MSRVTGERVQAFSIGFQEARYNELDYAELAARHFDAAHYTKIVTADEALQSLPDLVAAYDEPFGNNSALAAYLCARLARETGVRVLLAGDGGDEIFGGNERYRRDRILARYHLIPAWLRHGLLEPLVRRFPAESPDLRGKARRYVERACLPNPERFYSSEFYVSQNRHRLLHPDFQAVTTADQPLEIARGHFRAAATSAELNRLLHVDLKITLGDNDLFKVVRTAEAAGVAVRFPLLDHPLVELMATLPVSYKVRGGEKRDAFKRAFRDLLPRETLAKVKHGFGLPTSDWLKDHKGFRELGRDLLLSSHARQRGYFAPGAVEELFQLHEADHTPFYGDILWTLLMRQGRAPRNALALTFDDGYRDNLTHVAPILKRLGLPATIFLVTGFIGTPNALWVDRVAMAFKIATARRVVVGHGRMLPLGTVRERLLALDAALAHLKRVPNEDRLPAVDHLISALHPGAPERPKRLMLSWDEG